MAVACSKVLEDAKHLYFPASVRKEKELRSKIATCCSKVAYSEAHRT